MSVTNSIGTVNAVAKEALMLLDNNLVFGNLVYRGYESEFDRQNAGYKKGNAVRVRKPARYTVRDGRIAIPQASTEKDVTITVDTQAGVDLQFTSADLTLSVADFSERFLKGAMIPLANSVDVKIAALYKKVWNWVGTPGTLIDSYADFGRAPQRLDEMLVPGPRCGVLAPADHWALIPTIAATAVDGSNRKALERARLPLLGDVDLYGTANILTHTVGPLGGAPLVNGGTQSVAYDGSNVQSLITDGWTASGQRVKAGDVFTIAGVFAVNPVTGASYPYLQQFVVNADGSSDGSGNLTLNISPAIITTGAYKTVSNAPADNAALTFLGSANAGYTQNLAFHKSAFALTMVPMEKPEGAVKCFRESHKGLSVRIVPYYDGTNDESNWRLDILYTVTAIYPDLATRVSG